MTTRNTRPRPVGMTPAALRKLMAQAGITTGRELSKVVGVAEPCISRWLTGSRNISKPYAAFIREKLAPRLATRMPIG